MVTNFRFPVFAISALVLAGCSKQPAAKEAEAGTPAVGEAVVPAPVENPTSRDGASGPTIAEIAGSYETYIKVTDKAVYVNPELAIQCIAVSEDQIRAARIDKGPHADSAIHIFMNESAFRAFPEKDGLYPEGSVIVKQKLRSGWRDTAAGVGGMVKRAPGFDADHGDWEYFYFEDKSKIESGRLATCVQCHAKAAGTDYVFGTWSDADHLK